MSLSVDVHGLGWTPASCQTVLPGEVKTRALWCLSDGPLGADSPTWHRPPSAGSVQLQIPGDVVLQEGGTAGESAGARGR